MVADNPMRIVSIRYRGFNGHFYTKEFGSAAEFRKFGQRKDWYKIRSAVVRTANGMEFELAHGYWNIPVGANPEYYARYEFIGNRSRKHMLLDGEEPIIIRGTYRYSNGYRVIEGFYHAQKIGVWC